MLPEALPCNCAGVCTITALQSRVHLQATPAHSTCAYNGALRHCTLIPLLAVTCHSPGVAMTPQAPPHHPTPHRRRPREIHQPPTRKVLNLRARHRLNRPPTRKRSKQQQVRMRTRPVSSRSTPDQRRTMRRRWSHRTRSPRRTWRTQSLARTSPAATMVPRSSPPTRAPRLRPQLPLLTHAQCFACHGKVKQGIHPQ